MLAGSLKNKHAQHAVLNKGPWGGGRTQRLRLQAKEGRDCQLYNKAIAHLEDKGISPGLTLKSEFKCHYKIKDPGNSP